MAIRVRFFASLRERLDVGDQEIELGSIDSVGAVWQQVTGQDAVPTNVLCSVNMEYVKAGAPVADGDEVAFFPPVTGG